jgi:hypothetical protein
MTAADAGIFPGAGYKLDHNRISFRHRREFVTVKIDSDLIAVRVSRRPMAMDLPGGWYPPCWVIRIWWRPTHTYLARRVLVLSHRPARILADIAIDLPYPRHRGSARFAELRQQVLGELGLQVHW